MAVWLYQMTADKRNKDAYSPGDYRKDVHEPPRGVSFAAAPKTKWGVGKIRSKSGLPPRTLDLVVFFFAPAGNKEPGIYGWGVIHGYDAANRELSFCVVSPSDILKLRPAWDNDIKNLVDKIRGFPRGNMWEITDEDWAAIQMEVGCHMRPEDWVSKGGSTMRWLTGVPGDVRDLLDRLHSREENLSDPSILETGETMIDDNGDKGWVKGAFNVIPGGVPGGCHETLVVAIGHRDDVEKRILQALAHVNIICKDRTKYIVFWAVVWDTLAWKKYREGFKNVTTILQPHLAEPITLR